MNKPDYESMNQQELLAQLATTEKEKKLIENAIKSKFQTTNPKEQPKFKIGQTVYSPYARNVLCDVIDCRWGLPAWFAGRAATTSNFEYQYKLDNWRYIEDGQKIEQGPSDWVEEFYLHSPENMKKVLHRAWDDIDPFDDPTYQYDADSGKVFRHGECILEYPTEYEVDC